MPAVNSGKVLVTGATGYIAGVIIKTLLEQGFAVRGTVRAVSKGAGLKKTFKSYGDEFELAVVEDMAKDGAFDEAVKGVVAIMHVASPVHLNADDPNELIGPAVAGTLGILRSAFEHGSAVKRVVITSSCATVITALPDFRVFNEEDWNDGCVKEVETKGRDAAPIDKYRCSKLLAERAAYKFVEDRKDRIGFDIATIHPPWVFGPSAVLPDSPTHLGTSMGAWWEAVTGAKDNNYLTSTGGEWVDVREVSLAHVQCLRVEAAGGNRFITRAGPYKFQHWATIAHSIDPTLPAGDASFDLANAKYAYAFDASKSQRILGIKYRSMEETTKDALAQFKEIGWLA